MTEVEALEAEKALAAKRAAEWVVDGMIVGLGSGSTAAHVVRELGRRVAAGLHIETISTSKATEDLARSLAIPITSFEHHPVIDLTIDGADEVDPSLEAIKGGGGAFLREKVVATASRRMIGVVDSSKLVDRLGRSKLPLEVLPFALHYVLDAVRKLGAEAHPRLSRTGELFVTDQGNHVLDTSFGFIDDPRALAATLDSIPGILEHGLFVDEIDVLVIGRGGGVEIQERTR